MMSDSRVSFRVVSGVGFRTNEKVDVDVCIFGLDFHRCKETIYSILNTMGGVPSIGFRISVLDSFSYYSDGDRLNDLIGHFTDLYVLHPDRLGMLAHMDSFVHYSNSRYVLFIKAGYKLRKISPILEEVSFKRQKLLGIVPKILEDGKIFDSVYTLNNLKEINLYNDTFKHERKTLFAHDFVCCLARDQYVSLRGMDMDYTYMMSSGIDFFYNGMKMGYALSCDEGFVVENGSMGGWEEIRHDEFCRDMLLFTLKNNHNVGALSLFFRFFSHKKNLSFWAMFLSFFLKRVRKGVNVPLLSDDEVLKAIVVDEYGKR